MRRGCQRRGDGQYAIVMNGLLESFCLLVEARLHELVEQLHKLVEQLLHKLVEHNDRGIDVSTGFNRAIR
jgi:hypothetical protein